MNLPDLTVTGIYTVDGMQVRVMDKSISIEYGLVTVYTREPYLRTDVAHCPRLENIDFLVKAIELGREIFKEIL